MRVYLDANAIILAMEGEPPAAEAMVAIMEHRSADFATVTSQLSMAEILVAPIRERDFSRIEVYAGLLAGGGQLECLAVSRDVLLTAARIRAAHPSLKLPDAIHLASAECAGCSHIITGDKRLAAHAPLPVVDTSAHDLSALLEQLP